MTELSVYTVYLRELARENFPELLRRLSERSVSGADIIDDELSTLPLEEYTRVLRSVGMKPSALVITEDFVTADDREEVFSKIQGQIYEMEKAGVPLLMAAPSIRLTKTDEEPAELRDRMIEGLGRIIGLAEKAGIRVVIENQSSIMRPDSRARDLRYILDALPSLGFVFDSGNFYPIGEDALCSFDILSDRIEHVHMKDWIRDPLGKMKTWSGERLSGCAIGEGFLPNGKIAKRLSEIGYRGRVTLEINATDIDENMLIKSADHLRRIILNQE